MIGIKPWINSDSIRWNCLVDSNRKSTMRMSIVYLRKPSVKQSQVCVSISELKGSESKSLQFSFPHDDRMVAITPGIVTSQSHFQRQLAEMFFVCLLPFINYNHN